MFPYPQERLDEARKAVADGKMITCFIVGMYAQLRNWMGVENLSLAFYDYPEMIRNFCSHERLLHCHIAMVARAVPQTVTLYQDRALPLIPALEELVNFRFS